MSRTPRFRDWDLDLETRAGSGQGMYLPAHGLATPPKPDAVHTSGAQRVTRTLPRAREPKTVPPCLSGNSRQDARCSHQISGAMPPSKTEFNPYGVFLAPWPPAFDLTSDGRSRTHAGGMHDFPKDRHTLPLDWYSFSLTPRGLGVVLALQSTRPALALPWYCTGTALKKHSALAALILSRTHTKAPGTASVLQVVR